MLYCQGAATEFLNSIADIVKASSPAAAACTATTISGAPVAVVAAFGTLSLFLYYAWRVFERPDLFERWLDVRDRRESRKAPCETVVTREQRPGS